LHLPLQIYLEGRGVRQSDAEAIKWHRRATEKARMSQEGSGFKAVVKSATRTAKRRPSESQII
jgi:TPR repeat protein